MGITTGIVAGAVAGSIAAAPAPKAPVQTFEPPAKSTIICYSARYHMCFTGEEVWNAEIKRRVSEEVTPQEYAKRSRFKKVTKTFEAFNSEGRRLIYIEVE